MIAIRVRWALLALLPVADLAAQSGGAVARDSAGVKIIESTTPVWTSANAWRVDPRPLITIGTADQSADAQFGKVVGAHRLVDGNIVVADQKAFELRVFDAKGTFVRRLGRKGEGPGEFGSLSALLPAAADTLLTSDFRARRITFFNASGKVIKTLTMDFPKTQHTSKDGTRSSTWPLAIGRFADGSLLTRLGHIREESRVSRINSDTLTYLHGDASNQQPIGEFFSNENWEYWWKEYVIFDPRPFGRTGQIVTGARSFYFTDASRFEVREYSPDGRLVRVLRIRRPLVPVPADAIARFATRALDSVETKLKDAQVEINKWMVYPKMLPTFSALMLDPAGRLWARIYDVNPLRSRWDVFEVTGRHLGTVTMPDNVTVLEIGRDYIVALAHGPDDEDIVQVYRLHGG